VLVPLIATLKKGDRMPQTTMLTSDVNLMNVTDPHAPFRLIAPIFKRADIVFSKKESG